MQLLRTVAALACMASLHAAAALIERDDAGVDVVLAQPARRVVSLAPHVTELLFAAGGGGRVVGTVRFSDFPPAARRLPRVGDNLRVDIERLLALKPDLLVVWRHDAASAQLEQLRGLGIPLFYSDPSRLDDVPRTVLRLGRLMGTERQAEASAADMRRRLRALAERHRERSSGGAPVRVFYQVWDKPLYTLNERHIVTDAIRFCGGENVFAGLAAPAPELAVEAVVREDPEAIVSGELRGRNGGSLDLWQRFPSLTAVGSKNLFAIDADLLNAAGPRILDGVEALCAAIDRARARRPEGRGASSN